LQEEFDLLDAPFADRGERADDALRALRACLSQPEPAYHGTHYSFGGLVIDPCAVQARVPIWVGGRTRRSLRRAVSLADGWCPFGITLTQAREWLDRTGVPDGFDVILGPNEALDPIQNPEGAAAALTEIADSGATIAAARFIHHSFQHYLEQLEALADVKRPEAAS
jgi:hypothetical protein